MKKIFCLFQGKIFLPIAIASLIVTSCASNDTNPATQTGTEEDTTMMHGDSSVADHTRVEPADTSALHTGDSTVRMNPDTLKTPVKDSAAKAKADKAKKGKVSIVLPNQKSNKAAMEIDKDGYYANTEILPAFPGGQKALERFFEDNIIYPVTATENNAEGTVNLNFAVDENGKIYNPVAVNNPIGYGIEEEAVRVFKKMPTWTPGRIKGKNVKTRYTLPVTFQLF
jgi:periplasmic protein TonB